MMNEKLDIDKKTEGRREGCGGKKWGRLDENGMKEKGVQGKEGEAKRKGLCLWCLMTPGLSKAILCYV